MKGNSGNSAKRVQSRLYNLEGKGVSYNVISHIYQKFTVNIIIIICHIHKYKTCYSVVSQNTCTRKRIHDCGLKIEFRINIITISQSKEPLTYEILVYRAGVA